MLNGMHAGGNISEGAGPGETAQHGVTPAEALELRFVEELMMKYDYW